MEQMNQGLYNQFLSMLVNEIIGQVNKQLELKLKEEKTEILVLSPKEAMEVLDVSQTVMYNDLLKRKDFPSYRVGNKWYISKQGLAEWVEKQANKEWFYYE